MEHQQVESRNGFSASATVKRTRQRVMHNGGLVNMDKLSKSFKQEETEL